MPGNVVSPPEPPAVGTTPPLAEGDVRASRLYVLSRGPLITLVRRGVSIVSLVVLDLIGLALGLYLALVIRQLVYGQTDILWNLLWTEGPAEWLPFLAPITILVFLQANLYAVRERRPGIGRIVASLVMVALIVLAFGLGTDYDFTTTGLIPTAVVTCSATIGLLRAAYASVTLDLMQRAGIRRRAVLVGNGDSIRRLHAVLGEGQGGIPYEFLGAVTTGGATDLPVLGSSLSDLRAVLEQLRPDELVLTEQELPESAVLQAVEVAHSAGVRVRIAPSTTEMLVREGEYVPGQAVPLFELRPPVLTGVQWGVKRAFDIGASALLALLFAPLWLAIAIAIKLDSRGPVFYVDRRIGLGEGEFGMLKFRTMVEGAADQQENLEALNEASGALFKIRDDPRVTRVGRLLRRFSLDETPQLLNVLRGSMSLVGPRPLPRRDFELLEPWHLQRYRVLPGMTGLWQISGRSGLSFDDLVRLDFAYIENWSLWLDITILAKTIPAVLRGEGAY